MKICMLSSFYHPLTAGSEVFTKEISERLAADGHEVHVITGSWLQLTRNETIRRVHVHRVPSIWLKNLALPSVAPGLFFKGLDIVKECDIIHAHLAFPPGAVGATIKKLTNKPLLTTVQGGDVGIYPQSGLGQFFVFIKPLVSYSLKNSDRVTAISAFLADKAKDLGAREVILVRNGTDIDRFNPDAPFKEIKKRRGITDGPIILTVSRLVPKNGVDVLISAFAKLKEEIPNTRLVIAGDGPERNALEKLAHKLRLDKSIHFLGYVSHNEMPNLMNMADVFVRVSLEEGLGIVFTEAMACKTLVIGSNVGGIPDIIKNRRTGLLVPLGDAEATATAIKQALTDKSLREKLVDNAYEVVKEEFSWDSIYTKLIDVYSQILENSK